MITFASVFVSDERIAAIHEICLLVSTYHLVLDEPIICHAIISHSVEELQGTRQAANLGFADQLQRFRTYIPHPRLGLALSD